MNCMKSDKKFKLVDGLVITQLLFQLSLYSSYVYIGSHNNSIAVILQVIAFAATAIGTYILCKKEEHPAFLVVVEAYCLVEILLYFWGTKIFARCLEDKDMIFVSDFFKFYICYYLVTLIVFIMLLMKEVKKYNVFQRHWKLIFLLIYLICGVFFALIYYLAEYYISNQFAYNSELTVRNKYENILNLNVGNERALLEDNKEAFIEILRDDNLTFKEGTKDYVINGVTTRVAGEKIGKSWASIFYSLLQNNQYNRYYIESVSNIKLSDLNYVNKGNILPFNDSFYDEDYVLIKSILYTDENDVNDVIMPSYEFDYTQKNYEVEYLLYAPEDYYELQYSIEGVGQYIYLYYLANSKSIPMSLQIYDIAEGSYKFTNYLYYSFISLTTLGFGDMTPITALTKLLTITESVLGLIFMGLFLAKIFDDRWKQ